MLKLRGSVQVWRLPQLGHGTDSLMSTVSGSATSCLPAYSSWRWSSRKRLWHDWHSTSGSVNVARWPLASQVRVGRMIAESRPTMSSRVVTMNRHHCFLTFSLSSTPSGP